MPEVRAENAPRKRRFDRRLILPLASARGTAKTQKQVSDRSVRHLATV